MTYHQTMKSPSPSPSSLEAWRESARQSSRSEAKAAILDRLMAREISVYAARDLYDSLA